MILEIVRCKGCGRLAVLIGDTRITNHKCAGAWTTVASEEFDEDVAVEAIRSKKEEQASPRRLIRVEP